VNVQRLIEKAQEARQKAWAPYSRFKVGAALLSKGGRIYTGCNIELSSFSLTLCAERVALFKALSEGERDFKAIAIVADGLPLCPPCGACRQALWDFAPDIQIILANPEGEVKVCTLSDLFPKAFDAGYLPYRKRKET